MCHIFKIYYARLVIFLHGEAQTAIICLAIDIQGVAQLMCGMGESSLSRQRLANGLTTPAAFLLRMLLMQLINSFCLLTTKIYFYNKLIQMKLVTGSTAPRISNS